MTEGAQVNLNCFLNLRFMLAVRRSLSLSSCLRDEAFVNSGAKRPRALMSRVWDIHLSHVQVMNLFALCLLSADRLADKFVELIATPTPYVDVL
jgi:hypothetical protein